MKKYLIVLFGLSFLFFSCASKPKSEIEDSFRPDSITAEALPEETNSHEATIAESSDETDEIEELNTQIIDEEAYFAELEELADPEVTDLEYVENVEVVEELNEIVSEKNTTTENDSNDNNESIEDSTENNDNTDIVNNATTENQSENKNKTTDSNKTEQPKTEKNQQNQDDDEIIDLTMSDSDDDIIEVLDDSSDSTPEEVEPIIIIPSRKVTLKIGQTLEVMYPGSGWIYMGTTDNTKDFAFLGKKLGTQNTKFTFTAKAEGTKILHFYKNDALTENYIDDYLEVEITNQKDNAKSVVPAPVYKQPVPVKKEPKKVEVQPVTEAEKTEISPAPVTSDLQTKKSEPAISPAKVQPTEVKKAIPVTEQSDKNETVLDSEKTDQNIESLSEKEIMELLKQAHSLYDSKDYKNALNKINQFFEYSTKNRDEAFYLQGQIYEASASTKNIKLAIESYKTVTKNYPASPYWDDANKRIIYLTKFYLEGR